MKKIVTFLSLSFAIAGFSQADEPSTYYNNFNWTLTGTNLRTALATKITSTHTKTLNYQGAEDAIKIVDLDPTDATNTNVLLLYGFSNNICPASQNDDNDHRRRNKNSDGGGAVCQWNREHTYAQSLGTGPLGQSGPGADAHHLRASDVQRNGQRGSKKFGAGSGNSGSVGSNWYPGDEWKGDVARMMMYMYVRYGNRCLPKNVTSGTPNSSDPNMINLLLEWNVQDPVSAVEDQRNNYLGNPSNTYGQGNRNPFIDNPYLATIIWGGTPAENRWPEVFLSLESFATLDNVVIYPNPSNNHKINIDTPTELDQIQLININGQIIQQIKKPVMQNNSYSLDNLPSGFYLLKLTAGSSSATKKVVIN